MVTDGEKRPVWQWPYSVFGDNKPTGALRKTHNPNKAVTSEFEPLRATEPIEFGLRFPGQMDDPEAGVFYNYFRDYQAVQGRYTQFDPIGLRAG